MVAMSPSEGRNARSRASYVRLLGSGHAAIRIAIVVVPAHGLRTWGMHAENDEVHVVSVAPLRGMLAP